MDGLKMYRCRYAGGEFTVSVIDNGRTRATLDDRRDVTNFGSHGFSWGGVDDHSGNQLAFAMLADVLGDKKALELAVHFRQRYLDFFSPNDPFRFSCTTVAALAAAIESDLSVNTPWRKAS